MSIVDPVTVSYLKAQALYVAADAAIGAWGDRAVTSEIISAIVTQADTVAEAARQSAFMGPPMVVDLLDVDGLRIDLLGKAVTIIGDRANYTAATVVFVIGAAEQDDAERTRLTVLRRMT